MWSDDKFIAFDFETSGTKPEYALQPWRLAQGKFWATSFVWMRKKPEGWEVHGGLQPTNAMMREMLQTAIDENLTILGWNTLFDIQCLIAYGFYDMVMKCKWLDGMHLWRHFFLEPEYDLDRSKKKHYGLKNFVAEYLPEHAGYEEDIDFHDDSPEARALLHKYNIKDVKFTYRGARHFYQQLEPNQLRAALIEAACLPMIAKANFDGMVVDPLVAHELQAMCDQTAAAKLAQLAPHGMTEKIVRSPKQLSKLMFDDWELPVYKTTTTKKGETNRSTDKETLHELAFIDKRANTIKEYREALNNKTKFALAPIVSAEYNGDGRTRPAAIVFGTYSGRMTYASKQGKNKDERPIGFAIHQMVRGPVYRETIVAPEGYTLVEFDAAGQEFKWMAVASKDATMLELCLPGEDAHSYMGSRITRVDYREMIRLVHEGDKVAKAGRQLGKVANLCLAAGTVILTNRGPCSIEHVRRDDLVWDGIEFVRHAGVVCSGVKQVVTYQGVTATPDHKVLTRGEWVEIQEVMRRGWAIEPALGTGWTGKARSAVRIVDGLVRCTVSEVCRAVREGTLRLWSGAGCEPALLGDGALGAVQVVRVEAATLSRWTSDRRGCLDTSITKACQRVVSEMQQPQRQIVQKLRRAWDHLQILVSAGGGRVRQDAPAAQDILRYRHRPREQRWSLRAWKLALGFSQGQPAEQATARVYDITNCGPRTRFAANGVIVHNSLQYRTSAPKLRVTARVQHNIPMDETQARFIHRTYQQTYQGVPRYWEKQIAMTRRLGYVETFGGRRVQVVGEWDGRMGWSMGSTAINYRIQGTGADQKYLALAVIRPYLTEIGAYFGWDLHDGIYLYVPDRKVEKAVADIRQMLNNLPYARAWGFTPPIPMPWDCKVGKAWGSLKEWKEH